MVTSIIITTTAAHHLTREKGKKKKEKTTTYNDVVVSPPPILVPTHSPLTASPSPIPNWIRWFPVIRSNFFLVTFISFFLFFVFEIVDYGAVVGWKKKKERKNERIQSCLQPDDAAQQSVNQADNMVVRSLLLLI